MLNTLRTDGRLECYCLLLYTLVRQERPLVMVETGREDGHSTYWAALAMQHNGQGVLHSLEIKDRPATRARLAELEAGGWVKCHVGNSHGDYGRALAAELGHIDALYIDGRHDAKGVTGDCSVWVPLAKRMVVVHDWARYPGADVRGVATPFLDALTSEPGWGSVYFQGIDMAVFKK